jgi:hypothetical protein
MDTVTALEPKQVLYAKLRDANQCDGGDSCKCDVGNYYVHCIDGPSSWIMAGPYQTHQAAHADKERVLRIADDIDGRAWFMSWSIVRMADTYTKPGRMNTLGLL